MHTPGPWRVTPSCRIGNGSAWRDILSDGTEFAPSYVGEALDKDAALIAAAPDLLAALRALMALEVKGHALADRLQFSDAGRALLNQCRAAIARATSKD
jgi:hypothetical protein